MQDLPALPVGISDIHQLLSGHYVYVDKTKLISDLIRYPRVYIARPHGFGKSTLVSTLAELFRHGSGLFEGKDIYKKWPEDKCYYVITIKLHGLEALPADRLEYRLCLRLVSAFINAGFNEAEAYLNCGDFDTLSVFLTKIVTKHHVVILIDDWDYPLRSMLCSNLDAHQTPLWDYCISVLKVVFDWLHDLPNLRFCLVTGELYGLSAHLKLSNDFVDLTFSSEFTALLGFTEIDIFVNADIYKKIIIKHSDNTYEFDDDYNTDHAPWKIGNIKLKEEYFQQSYSDGFLIYCPEDIYYFFMSNNSDSEGLTSFFESIPTQQLLRTYLKHPSSKFASAYIPKENNINIHDTSTLLTPNAILTQLGLFSNDQPSTKSIKSKLALLFANRRFDYNDNFKQTLACIHRSFDNNDIASTVDIDLQNIAPILNEALTYVKSEVWDQDNARDILLEILAYSGLYITDDIVYNDKHHYVVFGERDSLEYNVQFIDFDQSTIVTKKAWKDYFINKEKENIKATKESGITASQNSFNFLLTIVLSQRKRKVMATSIYEEFDIDECFNNWFDPELI